MDTITKEELKQLLAASPGNKYFLDFDRDTTVIKEQTVNVHAGGNFYNGRPPKEDNDACSEDESRTDISTSYHKTKFIKNKINRLYSGIKAVYDSGLIHYKYEYAAVFKAIEELRCFDKFQRPEFITLLQDSKAFLDNDYPSISNIDDIIIKGEFPNWKVEGKGYVVTKSLIDIAECFLKAYYSD